MKKPRLFMLVNILRLNVCNIFKTNWPLCAYFSVMQMIKQRSKKDSINTIMIAGESEDGGG